MQPKSVSIKGEVPSFGVAISEPDPEPGNLVTYPQNSTMPSFPQSSYNGPFVAMKDAYHLNEQPVNGRYRIVNFSVSHAIDIYTNGMQIGDQLRATLPRQDELFSMNAFPSIPPCNLPCPPTPRLGPIPDEQANLLHFERMLQKLQLDQEDILPPYYMPFPSGQLQPLFIPPPRLMLLPARIPSNYEFGPNTYQQSPGNTSTILEPVAPVVTPAGTSPNVLVAGPPPIKRDDGQPRSHRKTNLGHVKRASRELQRKLLGLQASSSDENDRKDKPHNSDQQGNDGESML